MSRYRLHLTLALTVAWTLGLLTLGSVVHATESSLACPDWPTCFGTMMPEMVGGVFWEHLHRLVAGGLLLLFAVATAFAFRDAGDRPWIPRAAAFGMGLLLVQAVFGGLTVIYRLPDAISTTHLALAFGFLALAVVLATATSARRPPGDEAGAAARRVMRRWGATAAGLVFVQSLVGAVVRHTDAGLACPDFPTCLGQWVPPVETHFVAVHLTHRVLGVVATLAVIGFAVALKRAGAPRRVMRWARAALVVVAAQFSLGIASVLTLLDVVPVSLHTLGAAGLLAILVHLTALGHGSRVDRPATHPEDAPVARVP